MCSLWDGCCDFRGSWSSSPVLNLLYSCNWATSNSADTRAERCRHYNVRRISDGPMRDCEKDVRNKTTMRFHPESTQHDPTASNEPDTLMVVIPFKPIDLIWLRKILFDEKRSSQKQIILFMMSPSRQRL
nr:CMP-N-acetylneuraminate-beta-galactosamide-alpha-2,3-sialyltransferase 4-like [Paramormyrops kingsleyae]